MKNKRILLIIGCIIIVGLVFGGFVLYQKHRIIELERERMVEVKDLPIEEVLLAERDRHILFHFEACLAGHRPELEPARDIRDKFYVLLEALSQRDKKACLRLDEKLKNECLRYFYAKNALLANNQEYCKKLGNLMQNIDWQKRCLAIIKNDVSLCEKVKDLFKKEVCKAIILGPEHCDRLSGYYKIPITRTESIEGVVTRRVEIIEISEQEAKLTCRQESYLVRAIKNQNPAMCEYIGTKEHLVMSICRILSNPDPKQEFRRFHQGFCYEKFALDIARIKNDPSVCEKIPAKKGYNLIFYQHCLAQFK